MTTTRSLRPYAVVIMDNAGPVPQYTGLSGKAPTIDLARDIAMDQLRHAARYFERPVMDFAADIMSDAVLIQTIHGAQVIMEVEQSEANAS